MPLFGSICGLFTTGETKSLFSVPAFNPRLPTDAVESRRHIRVNAPGGGSGGGGGSKGGGGSSSGGGNSGGRGTGGSSSNTGGAKGTTSANTAAKSATTSAAATNRGFMSSAASYAKGALSSASTSLGNLASSVARSPVGQAVSSAWNSTKSAVASSSVGQTVSGAWNSVSSAVSGAYNSAKSSIANSNMSKSVSSGWNSAKSAISNALGMSSNPTAAKSVPAANSTTTPAKQSTWSSALSSIAARLGISTPAASTTAKPTTTTVTTPTGFVSPQVRAQFNSLMNALSQWSPSQIGAGALTRKQNGMSNLSPDAASAAMAKKDEKRAQALNSTFVAAEKITGVPAVIGEAIASRETHVDGPRALSSQGMSPAPGNMGYGTMQVDQKAHPGTALGPAKVSSLQHVVTAEKIFNQGLQTVQKQHPNWSATTDLRAAIDRYNGGESKNSNGLDNPTTGHDYGGDVLGRAQQFQQDGLGN